MHEEIFRALENGATAITASRRLARVLAREFHGIQTARGRKVWDRPDILPLSAYLDRMWRDWLWRGGAGDVLVLLNEVQEQALWQQIIRDSPAGESLLQIPETARQAAKTWQLVSAYRLQVDGSFEGSEDSAAFATWCRAFRQLCRADGWLAHAQLSDFLRERIAAREVERPREVYVAGFDDITPQQREFLDALGPWRSIASGDTAGTVERRSLRDSPAEIRGAATWARGILEADGAAQIGVIVTPDLTQSRSAVDWTFREILEPGTNASERESAFHLSVGPPLGDYPLIRAALLMLEFAQGPLPLSRAGILLRSPFLGGAEAEASARAQLDVKLRKKSLWDIDLAALRESAASCPALQQALARVERISRTLMREQMPSEWSRDIAGLLAAFGWPGERSLDSAEFQIVEAWRGVLDAFASLDLVGGPMKFSQVLEWLHENVANARFQAEDEGAPIQVMGMLEAAGLRFDHLWIMGLHDEALPAAANPNPFIPVALQRRYGLPHSSAARELEFAATLMDRLLKSASNIVLSYPEREGDRALAPSPLVTGEWHSAPGEDSADGWIARMRAAAEFETLADQSAPALARNTSPGGAAIFKDMAACPFRAFARHRLAARRMEDPDLGLSYRDRGTTVHKALEVVWRELGSHARLVALAPADIDTLIAQGADAAAAKLGPGIGRDLEKRRLQKLLRGWLEIEKSRPDFTVAEVEAERVASISGLEVKIRADRVDALPDGREIILDYKTGLLEARAWDGERPDEPQLPLYCVTNERPVAGAAFAQIRTGELRFRGMTMPDAALPKMGKMTITPPLPFDAQMKEWRAVLGSLATNFRGGLAAVDPKPGACDNCGLRALCRIRELESGVRE
jgi:probable DNA repair protein